MIRQNSYGAVQCDRGFQTAQRSEEHQSKRLSDGEMRKASQGAVFEQNNLHNMSFVLINITYFNVCLLLLTTKW